MSQDLVVFVGSMEELGLNPKHRPDNPYFVIGIGNPEILHIGSVTRFRSGKRSSTRRYGGQKVDLYSRVLSFVTVARRSQTHLCCG